MSHQTSCLRVSLLVASVLAGCAAPQAERPRPAATVTPPSVVAPVDRPVSGLYGADEALRDALSGPWEYVGTGDWPGISRTEACVFRNQRVLIVNVYCTITETQAFRVDVYSPARGRVRIYAESRGPVSTFTRADYFTFTAETEPPPGPSAQLPPVALSWSFDQLSSYDAQRYRAFLPACYGGVELSKEKSGCLGPLAAKVGEWNAQNGSFLQRASNDWYRVVREMRALATRHGKEPD
jgi:hypothetical protein